jgi:hypothetical protein
MPYIKKEDRSHFVCDIEDIIDALHRFKPGHPVLPGELNFIISSLIWDTFDKAPSYTTGNMLVGVLECVKQEFIRRRLNDYEDGKIKENGDL